MRWPAASISKRSSSPSMRELSNEELKSVSGGAYGALVTLLEDLAPAAAAALAKVLPEFRPVMPKA